jgi:hypothetical protein
MYQRNVIMMVLMAAVCFLSSSANAAAETTLQHSRTCDLGFDWKFVKGDPADAQQVEFDEAGWKCAPLCLRGGWVAVKIV